MVKKLTLFGVAAIASACSTQNDEAVPLQEISDNPLRWDGKVVTVEGWLPQCSDLNCFIVPTRADLELVQDGCPGERCDLAIEAFDKRAVSIGYDEAFDRSAKPLQGTHVLVTAKVNAGQWLQPGLDRSEALQPISISSFGEQ
jgi:hypothetical protein